MEPSSKGIPRVAAVHDLSGFGRCSLTVAIPVLSVMGTQCCPLPTAVLSLHTGLDGFSFHDLTPYLPAYIESWHSHGLCFDAVYSGFLGSAEQIRLVGGFIDRLERRPLVLVDPVMADHGQLYATYTRQMCADMRALVSRADIITPNLTEACILTDTPYTGEDAPLPAVRGMARRLTELGPTRCVITGILPDEEHILNLAYDRETDAFIECAVERTHAVYSGTGDLFASVLCGCLAQGRDLAGSLQTACGFVRDATLFTQRLGAPVEDGVVFEPLLHQLGGICHAKD